MKRIVLFFLSAIFISTQVIAAPGSAGFGFLSVDFNARSSAMGGAYLAMRGDVSGILHNPAGMSYAQERQFGFDYVNYLLDISGGQAAFTHRLEGHGQITGIVSYFNYGKFEETTEFASKTGNEFGANDIALAISYADVLEDMFSYGVTLKYIHSKIDVYTAAAMALDFGLIYAAPFEDDLYFGLSLLNLGKPLGAFISTREDLPLSLRLGMTKKLAHLPLEFNIALNDLNVDENAFWDRFKKFSLGGEFTLSELLRLRLGYNNDIHSGLDTGTGAGFSGVSMGVGIYYNKYRFDYGYSSFGDLGATHRIGISGHL